MGFVCGVFALSFFCPIYTFWDVFPAVVCEKMVRGKVVRVYGMDEGSKGRGLSGWLYLRFNRCRTIHTFPFL